MKRGRFEQRGRPLRVMTARPPLIFLALLVLCAACPKTAPHPFSISGTVAGAGSAVVALTLSGSATATTNADSQGNYVFSGLPSGNYVVTPSAQGFAFQPV